MGHLTIWFRNENLTKKIEEAQTFVFVQTRSWESGRYQYLGGKDAGPAKAWSVTIALVDAADSRRRRVLEARSASPPKIKGNTAALCSSRASSQATWSRAFDRSASALAMGSGMSTWPEPATE
jgi:hypothetical protein